MAELSGVRSVGFVPDQSSWTSGVQRASQLLGDLAQRREAKKLNAQQEAEERVKMLFSIAETWGPGDWVKHSSALERAMVDAGHDESIAKMTVDAHMKQAQSAAAPSEARSRFGQTMMGLMAEQPVSALEAYQQALTQTAQTSPGDLFTLSEQLGNMPDLLAAPGERERMEAEANPEPSKLQQEYSFWSSLVGPEAAREIMVSDVMPAIDEEQLAYMAAQGNPVAQRSIDILRQNEAAKRLPTAPALALWAAQGNESAKEALDIMHSYKEGKRGATLTADQRKDMLAYAKSEPAFERISELSGLVNTGGGISAKIAGFARRKMAALNYDDSVAAYESVVEGFVSLFARALGHTGVLTEIDVERTRKLFPQVGDSRSLAKIKLANVKDLMRRVKNVAQTMDLTGQGAERPLPTGDVSDLDSMIAAWPKKDPKITSWAQQEYERHVSAGKDPAAVLAAIQRKYESAYGE